MLRSALHRIATSGPLGTALTPFVERFVGGSSVAEALGLAEDIARQGSRISMERATAMDSGDADVVVPDYLAMIDGLSAAGLAPVAEVAVFPHSLGAAAERVEGLCVQAHQSGVAAMLGMGQPMTVEPTLMMTRSLRSAGIPVGITLQSALRRTQRDCSEFSQGVVRLVKGGYQARGGPMFTSPIEVDKSFVRCARVLIQESKAPSFATHDPRLLEILESLVDKYGRAREDVEFAFYLGRNEREQRRMREAGHPIRIYLPFGPQWFERLVDGLVEHPGGLISALQSIVRPAGP